MASVGPHYDPLDRLNDLTEANYDTLCTPATPDMCELGDLTGKFEQLTIEGKISPNRAILCKFSLSDEFLSRNV